MTSDIAVVILAAGKGTRMKSTLPKVLHPLAHRPMVLHVLDAVAPLKPAHMLVITGHGAEQVEASVSAAYPEAQCLRQTEQLGTGHAVLQTKEILGGFTGTVLILNGDVPLVETTALEEFVTTHTNLNRDITIGSAQMADPTGLGRILRNDDGAFAGTREHKDCTEEELEIDEVNVGLYAVDGRHLFGLLNKITNDNAQQEYYLPDIAPLGLADGLAVEAEFFLQDPAELGGINNRLQLAEAETLLQDRYRTEHMLNGATLQDPGTTYFAWDTLLGTDVTVGQGVVFQPRVTVADGSVIAPFTVVSANK